MTVADTHRAIEAVWRIESARLIAGLARIVRDLGLAEDLAQEALVAALEQWPNEGVPDNPGAWLMGTAKHRAIDRLRRSKLHERKEQELARELEIRQDADQPDLDAALDDEVGDDLLRLVFTTCHPVLSTEARVALTLRLLGGLTTKEIARAFLVPEATVAQRIVRAKRTLSEAKVPFEAPTGDELEERLPSVLEVVYLVFNEGYAATAGDDWLRPELCAEALRLGRILAGAAARTSPRCTAWWPSWRSRPRGRPPASVPRASRCCCSTRTARAGTACSSGAAWPSSSAPSTSAAPSARTRCRPGSPPSTPGRPHAEETDWVGIVALYDALAQLSPSPVVELNRAVAVGMAFGPAAGLELVEALGDEPSLEGYPLLSSVRGDLLAKLGRTEEARAEFERAAALTRNTRERELMLERARRAEDNGAAVR